jgi:hypothetical protein
MLVVEGGLNASFFWKSESVLSLLIGLVIAACNILISCYLLGSFLLRRALHSKRRWEKILCVVGTFVTACTFLISHGLLAHVRDAKTAGEYKSFKDVVLNRFWSEPFLLEDEFGYFLFLVGIVFAIISAREGYQSIGDRDPERDRLLKAYWSARGATEEHEKTFMINLEAIIQGGCQEIDSIFNRSDRQIERILESLNKVEKTVGSVSEKSRRIHQHHEIAAAYIRQINRQVLGGTRPILPSTGETPKTSPDFGLTLDGQEIEGLCNVVLEAREKLRQKQAKEKDHLNSFFESSKEHIQSSVDIDGGRFPYYADDPSSAEPLPNPHKGSTIRF